jgi:hypothetical protein
MVQGYGDAYRYGLADWHAIIDLLASRPSTAPSVAGSRRRHRGSPGGRHGRPRQAALKRKIAEIRARGAAGGADAAAE